MATLDRDAQGAIANIARSRQNLERNARDLANLPLERQTAVERDLQTVDEQIAKLEATVRGSARIIDQAGRLPAHLLTQDEEPQFRYEVLRKNTSGDMMTIAATETTALLPGDVVRATALRIR
jgi:small-conductance mechanosensitive channel